MNPIKIALVGEYSNKLIAHRAIDETFRLVSQKKNYDIAADWISTTMIDLHENLPQFNGFWLVPGSPYKNLSGALRVIRHARENNLPFFGSCGGFQHAVLEYCLNQLKWSNAVHQEITGIGVGREVISTLKCSLIEKQEKINLLHGSKIRLAYKKKEIVGSYLCSYGINLEFHDAIFATAISPKLQIAALNQDGEVRAIELSSHPFYVATLFQPERSSLNGVISPIIMDFIDATIKLKVKSQ